jgi:hypothetical protein
MNSQNTNSLFEFKNKYCKYNNYHSFLRTISPYRLEYTLLYNRNNQYGGNKVKKINKVLEIFKEYNIKLDVLETEDKEIQIEFFTLDDKTICFAVLINQDEQIATLENLMFDQKCLPELDPKDVTSKLITIIKEICRQLNIKKIELTDNSHYNCGSKYTLDLKYANTLTSGQPYYYKYNFKFSREDVHKSVKFNKNRLENIKTSEINIEKIKGLCKDKLKDIKVDKDERRKIIKYIEELYEKYKNDNIKKFLNKIKYKFCVLFSLIIFDLFNMLELKMYTNKLMHVNL